VLALIWGLWAVLHQSAICCIEEGRRKKEEGRRKKEE